MEHIISPTQNRLCVDQELYKKTCPNLLHKLHYFIGYWEIVLISFHMEELKIPWTWWYRPCDEKGSDYIILNKKQWLRKSVFKSQSEIVTFLLWNSITHYSMYSIKSYHLLSSISQSIFKLYAFRSLNFTCIITLNVVLLLLLLLRWARTQKIISTIKYYSENEGIKWCSPFHLTSWYSETRTGSLLNIQELNVRQAT